MTLGLALAIVGWFWFHKYLDEDVLATLCIVGGAVYFGFAVDLIIHETHERILDRIYSVTVEEDEVAALAAKRAAHHE